MADSCEAVCFLSDRPGSQPCRLTLETGSLLIQPAGRPAARWAYPGITCEVGGDERDWLLISCPAAAGGILQLAIRDQETIATLAARTAGPAHDQLAGFAASRNRRTVRRQLGLAIGLLAVVAVVTASWLLLTRLGPTLVAATLPPASEQLLGELAAAQLLAGEETIAAGPAAAAVETIADRLVAAISENPGYRFEVHLVNSPQVNAVALPGGTIVVYAGLLAAAGSADEVAGVLAHEICHVLNRDGLRQMVSRLGAAALVRLVLGGGDLAGLVGQLGELDHLAYGREQERAADRAGLLLLVAADLPPAALPSFFRQLQRRDDGGLPGFLSTHPDTAARVAELRQLAATLPATAPRPLAIDWPAVQASLP